MLETLLIESSRKEIYQLLSFGNSVTFKVKIVLPQKKLRFFKKKENNYKL